MIRHPSSARLARICALAAATAMAAFSSTAAQAQGATVNGALGTVTNNVSTVVRDVSLALPPFRINPVAGTTSFQASLTWQGVARVYYVIRPDTITPNAPALFLLHGRGMTADRMANYTAAGELTRSFGVWVFLPQSSGSAGEWANDPSVTGAPDDVGFLNALMDVAVSQHQVNPRRLYFAGLSSGGFMSELMACRHSDRIAAIFSVAAAIRSSVRPLCTATRPLPVGLINGTADTVVPFDGIAAFTANTPPNLTGAQDTAAFWGERNGCAIGPVEMLAQPDVSNDTTTVTRRRYLGCPAAAPITMYTVTNGGHTWPGTPFATYTVGLGATTQDINATALAWEFMSPFQTPP